MKLTVNQIVAFTEAAKKLNDFLQKCGIVSSPFSPTTGDFSTARLNMKKITEVVEQFGEVEVKVS